MIRFNQLFSNKAFNEPIENPTVSISTLDGHHLHLCINKSEVITKASFEGSFDIWLSSLCLILGGKTCNEVRFFIKDEWKKHFGTDQLFWDLFSEVQHDVFFKPLEMLKAALDKYQGREHLYLDSSPLICRCFGLRESDILNEKVTKAGSGCRSCLPQIEKLKTELTNKEKINKRYFKELSYADWLLIIDAKLKSFPDQLDWQMNVASFKGKVVIIEYEKSVTQREEEEMSIKLQDFLSLEVDSDLSFFLRRC
jgi:hypothetical protein